MLTSETINDCSGRLRGSGGRNVRFADHPEVRDRAKPDIATEIGLDNDQLALL